MQRSEQMLWPFCFCGNPYLEPAAAFSRPESRPVVLRQSVLEQYPAFRDDCSAR